MKDMFKLDGKIAIVTGGAGGIGEALAMGIGLHGATVVVSSRSQEAIEKVAKQITEASGNPAISLMPERFFSSFLRSRSYRATSFFEKRSYCPLLFISSSSRKRLILFWIVTKLVKRPPNHL